MPSEAVNLGSGGASDEGPVDEHERQALRGAVVTHHLPRHRLLVRRLPPHARPAHATRKVCQALLTKVGDADQPRFQTSNVIVNLAMGGTSIVLVPAA